MQFGFGSGILTGVRTDDASTTFNTPVRFGALQEVSFEFNGDIKELFSTYQFPIDSARGKTKIQGKAKVAQISGQMYNQLFFGQTIATGQTKYAYNETTTLGTGTVGPTYTVSFAASTPLVDQGVFYTGGSAPGNQLTSVTTTPGSGQYSFNTSTGVYTFGTISNGLGMSFNYLYYSSTTGNTITIGNPPMGTTPRFQVTLFEQYPDSNSQIVLTLYACISARLSLPTRIDDYWIQDLDLSAFANSAGQVGYWSMSS